MAFSIVIMLLFQVFLGSTAQPTADIYWSMDEVEGVNLYPTIGNRTRWRSQLNVSDYRARKR